MGRILFLVALAANLLANGHGALAQEPPKPDEFSRRVAERVLRLGGQVGVIAEDKKTVIARRVQDLPEMSFAVTRIDLSGRSRITNADLAEIAKLPELAELNLSYTRITDQGLEALAPLSSLNRLYLSETQITDAGLQHLAGHAKLASLDLSGTNITKAPLDELAKLPGLSRLFLSRTKITAGAAESLAKFPKLSVLHLTGIPFEEANLKTLSGLSELKELAITADNKALSRLAELPQLKILTVHGSGISDAGLDALAKLSELEQLRLSQTAVSERGVQDLKRSLKNCRLTAHPVSRQSAFLNSRGQDRPVLRWQPGDAKSAWSGIIPRPAALPGLRRWQVETVEPRSEIYSVDFSPNGQRVACGTAAGHVRIYDANNLALLKLIPAHPGGVNAVAWSPDGTQLASAGADRLIRIWNSSGREERVLRGHRNIVMTVAWSPNGESLASGSWDNTVRLWKADGSASEEFKGHTRAVLSVAWNAQGTQIASGSEDKTIRLWDLAGKELHVMKGHTESVTAVAWSPRGSRIASGSWDKTIRFWNPRTGRSGGPVLEGHTYRIFGLEWHPEGTMLASVGDRTLRLWTLDGTPVKTAKTETNDIFALSWKHDGSEIATGTRFSSVLRIVNVNSNADRAIGENTNGGPTELAWNPDGDRIAAGCWDHTIRLISADGRAGAVLSGPTNNVRTLAWSPSGERLVSGGDALLRIWNRQGIPIAAVKEHERGIHSVAWSPDGASIASVSEDSTARIWSADAKVKTVIKLDPRANWWPGVRTVNTSSRRRKTPGRFGIATAAPVPCSRTRRKVWCVSPGTGSKTRSPPAAGATTCNFGTPTDRQPSRRNSRKGFWMWIFPPTARGWRWACFAENSLWPMRREPTAESSMSTRVRCLPWPGRPRDTNSFRALMTTPSGFGMRKRWSRGGWWFSSPTATPPRSPRRGSWSTARFPRWIRI